MQHALPLQRSHSPVHEIVEEVSYQCQGGGVGTDSPDSASGTSSSGSSGYPVSCSVLLVDFVTHTRLNVSTRTRSC